MTAIVCAVDDGHAPVARIAIYEDDVKRIHSFRCGVCAAEGRLWVFKGRSKPRPATGDIDQKYVSARFARELQNDRFLSFDDDPTHDYRGVPLVDRPI